MWCKWAPVAVGHQRHLVYWETAHLDAQSDQGCTINSDTVLMWGILCQKDVSTFKPCLTKIYIYILTKASLPKDKWLQLCSVFS